MRAKITAKVNLRLNEGLLSSFPRIHDFQRKTINCFVFRNETEILLIMSSTSVGTHLHVLHASHARTIAPLATHPFLIAQDGFKRPR